MDWDMLEAAVRGCRNCRLGAGRTNAVPGEGNRSAELMIIGEGPGRDEDLSGRPFVGKAGQLLDRMLAAIGLDRGDVYICNVVKCGPPGNRNPEPDEAAACIPFLRAQFSLIRPRVILCLGSVALRNVMDPQGRITRDRGQWTQRKGVWMMATYHPAALLRDESKKREAWADMQMLRDKLKELSLSE